MMIDIIYFIIPLILPIIGFVLAYVPDKIKEWRVEHKTSTLFGYWMDMRLEENKK